MSGGIISWMGFGSSAADAEGQATIDENGAGVEGRKVTFTLNGELQVVTTDVSPHTRLVDYIRYRANLKGTKVLCREGGCGACTVLATVADVDGDGFRSFGVQACQLLVYACSGWTIETIEHLGNRFDGYNNKLQQSLVGFYGTQCGYCSPGMIMAMYGELKKKGGSLTQEQVEAALDGNICRCTGYRPILDAFKSLAVDAEPKLKQQLADIEEAYKSKCPKSGEPCTSKCGGGCPSKASPPASPPMKAPAPPQEIHIDAGAVQWYQPLSLKGLYSIMRKAAPGGNTLLVSGSTGAGVFKDDGPYNRYISLGLIADLQKISFTPSGLELGARLSLTRCIDQFELAAQPGSDIAGFSHLAEIARHWKLVANTAVRNNGTWAGNLVLKNRHPEFPSDIFVTLAVCDASVKLGDATNGAETLIKVTELPSTDLSGKVLLSVLLPPLPSNTQVRTYKITPRAVNAHAYVNAAFRLPVDSSDAFKVTHMPALYFGGLGPTFVSASGTASFLQGNSLSSVSVVREAARRIVSEVSPPPEPHQGSVDYRKGLVASLFYKAVVSVLGDEVSPSLRSAGDKLRRGLNSGVQTYDENKDSWPVGEAVPKVESNIQVSGEAEYTGDIAAAPGELEGVFVQTNVANAKISSVDPAQALAMPGVVDFVSAVDIPGLNAFFGSSPATAEKLFATDKSSYAGQAVGLVVAKTRAIAVEAAKMVKISYSDHQKPVVTIEEGLKTGRNAFPMSWETGKFEECLIKEGLPFEENLKAAPHKLTGEMSNGAQFHLQMEALAARALPMEDGLTVTSTTQHINGTQSAISLLLDIPANSINMEVRRIGGGFGGKISRCNVVACAAALAATKTRKPVRINLDLRTHMSLVGWREPYKTKYEVGFDNQGKMSAVKLELYSDTGYINQESSGMVAASAAKSVYKFDSWNVKVEDVLTDTAPNTWCRTPGHVNGVAAMENVFEHVASFLKVNPLEVRLANLAPDQTTEKGGPNVFRTSILPLLKEKSNFEQRQLAIGQFNKENRWRKRGLSLLPLLYPFNYPPPFRYTAQVAIYEHDGTVAITHGGIEMGQGINTKAIQVAAKILGLPMTSFKIKPTNSVAGANSQVTGGSFGTDLVCHGVKICCERLHARIEAAKKKMPKEPSGWKTLIKACLNMDVDLSERYWTSANEHPSGYNIWAGACMEVEIDVLTGQYVMLRADIIEDTGRSLSPYVDVGQVEGAFIMGLGLFTSEQVQISEETGQKLVTGTWEYKPPTAMDIPKDMRVTFLPNASNPYGVMRSKATGEPPLCLSYCVVTALRAAVAAARADAGNTDWFQMDTPVTVERLQRLCLVTPEQFNLQA